MPRGPGLELPKRVVGFEPTEWRVSQYLSRERVRGPGDDLGAGIHSCGQPVAELRVRGIGEGDGNQLQGALTEQDCRVGECVRRARLAWHYWMRTAVCLTHLPEVVEYVE
jgi:hypothetical protein